MKKLLKAEKQLQAEKQLKAMTRTEFWAWLQFRYPSEWSTMIREFTFSIRPSGNFTLKEFKGLDIWHNKFYPERRLRLFIEWIVAERPPQFTKEDIADVVAFLMEQDPLS